MVSRSKPSNTYNDQSILMAALPFILLNSKSHFKKPPKFYIRSTDTSQVSSPASRSDMPVEKDLSALLKVNNIDLASLVPKIEFYKIVKDSSGKIIKEIYIPYAYDARNYAENIYGNRQQRGDDVGIKNVSFVYDEQNPAVAENLLGCTIDFVFANAEALVTKRNAGFSFSDLISYSTGGSSSNGSTSSEIVYKDAYDIVLKVGYQLDGVVDTLSADVRDALKKQDKMIMLGMTDFDLSFNANGMLNLSIQYKSSNVNYFSSKRNEIFGARRLTTKNSKYEDAASALLSSADEMSGDEYLDALDELDSTDPTIRRAGDDKPFIDLQALYSRIQTYMANNCMIHRFDASLVDEITGGDYYLSKNPCRPSGTKNDLKEDMSGELIQVGASSVDDIASRFVNSPTGEGKRSITYFYFGDLLEAIMATNPLVVAQMKSRKFAFLLDNVAYQFIKGKPVSVFNIAKMPISQSIFNSWFSKNIVAKDRKIMSLLSFVKIYITNFALGILRMRTHDQIGSDYTSNLVRRLVNIPNGLPDNKGIGGLTSLAPIKGKSYYGKSASNSYFEYYMIYDEAYYNDQLSNYMSAIDEDDRYYYNLATGVPHFYIGADRGLLKDFSFQKSAIGEEIAAIRSLENSGSPYAELWQMFDINAVFIGNNSMSVGKNIYIDPTITGLGSATKKGTVANSLGLGGYYMVTRVEHNYYPKWTTTVTAAHIVPSNLKESYTAKGSDFTYF